MPACSQIYQALELVKKIVSGVPTLETMNSGLEDLLRHHFRASWINKMIENLRAKPNQGQLQIHIDFPERQELGARATVAPQVVGVLCVGEATQKSHCCCYIGEGSLDKSQGVIEEAIHDSVTWAMRKGGVTEVLHLSDRARCEFSNASIMMWLSNHEKFFGVCGEWMFTEPNHGKSDCDGLGAEIKTMLYEWFGTLGRMPTPHKCVQFLWDHTKEVPLRGKYAKYKDIASKYWRARSPPHSQRRPLRASPKDSIGNRLVSQTMSWPAHCPVFVTFAKQSASMIVRTRGMRVLGNQFR